MSSLDVAPEGTTADLYLSEETGVAETDLLRLSLLEIFSGKSDVENIRVAGDLIQYIRDKVLPALAGVRRASAMGARSSLSPEQIASLTGLSKATISRLITEHRNYS